MNQERAFQDLWCHDWKLSSVLELFYRGELLGAVLDPSFGMKSLLQWLEGDMNGLSHSHWGPHKPKMVCKLYLALPTTHCCNLQWEKMILVNIFMECKLQQLLYKHKAVHWKLCDSRRFNKKFLKKGKRKGLERFYSDTHGRHELETIWSAWTIYCHYYQNSS